MTTVHPRCQHDILRDGYWTGKQCSRQATFIVTIDGKDKPMCTQHRDKTVQARWHKPESVTSVPIGQVR